MSYGISRRWRRRSKGGVEKNKSEHLVSLLVFVTSSTPVAHNKAQPRGPLVLLSSYLHNHSAEQWSQQGSREVT